MIDKQQLHEVIKTRELELEQAHELRQIEVEQAMFREEQDKEYIMQVEQGYRQEVEQLRLEKDRIVQQSQRIAESLEGIKQEYEFKSV